MISSYIELLFQGRQTKPEMTKTDLTQFFILVLANCLESDERPSSPPLTVDIDKFGDVADVPVSDFEAGDFIDDDFGLSLKLESEKIRQKQLLIEQEVSPLLDLNSFLGFQLSHDGGVLEKLGPIDPGSIPGSCNPFLTTGNRYGQSFGITCCPYL